MGAPGHRDFGILDVGDIGTQGTGTVGHRVLETSGPQDIGYQGHWDLGHGDPGSQGPGTQVPKAPGCGVALWGQRGQVVSA